jgi:hypothetical protein
MKFLYVMGCLFSLISFELHSADGAFPAHTHAPRPVKPNIAKHPTRPDSPYPPEISSSLQVKPIDMYSNGLSVLKEDSPPAAPVQPPMTRSKGGESDVDQQELRNFLAFLGQLSLTQERMSRFESHDESAPSWVVCAYLMGNLMRIWQRTSAELVTATDEKVKEQLAKKIKETAEHIEGVMHIAAQTNLVFKHLRNAYHGKRDGVDVHKMEDREKRAAA